MNRRVNQKRTQAENGEVKRPDWVAKVSRTRGKKDRLERIGVAWDREDGGICLRLAGTQIVDEDIYIYPVEDAPQS